jgi:hypothetical protein
VEGPGSAPPQHLPHSLRAARRLQRKERELPKGFTWASVHAAASVGKVVCAFCELPCQRVGVTYKGWGVGRLSIHGFWMYYEEYLAKMRGTDSRNKSSRFRKINFANHHNIQTVPKSNKQSNTPCVVARFYWISIRKRRPEWRQAMSYGISTLLRAVGTLRRSPCGSWWRAACPLAAESSEITWPKPVRPATVLDSRRSSVDVQRQS